MDPLVQEVIFLKIILVAAMLSIASNSDRRWTRIAAVVAAILFAGSAVRTVASHWL